MKGRTTVWLGILVTVLSAWGEAQAQGWTQDRYRWRSDDGSETAATWKDAENTPISGVKRCENLRLRFALLRQNVNTQFIVYPQVLQYATSTSGPWTKVPEPLATGELPAGAMVAMAPTTWFANYDSTTAQLGSGGTFAGGKCVEDQAAPPMTLFGPSTSNYYNHEYAVQLSPAAPRNTAYFFRLDMMNQYSVYAQLTVENADYTYPPTIVSSLTPQNIAGGLAWSYTIVARGLYPLTYAASGLPQGLTLTGNVLSGIPTEYGSFPVTLTVSDANGPTTAVLTLNVSTPAAEVIVDDADAAHTTATGTWPASASTTDAWSGGCVYGDPAAETAALSFRWTPEIPLAANYQVYARWTAGEYRGRNVPYTIQHAGGAAEVFVNQRALAGQWNLLGTYAFNLGTSGWVELAGHDGQACADAVRFVRVSGGNQPPTIVSAAWADANPVTLPAGTTVHVVASDPDGDPLAYAWSQVSGAGTATFATPTAAASGVTFSVAGTYGLRVTVSDGRGGSVTSDVSVTVNPGAGVDPRADCNADGVVNALDLQIVIANFGQSVP